MTASCLGRGGVGRRWFTADDTRAAFNLFCCVYGIGTLGMPANFARAGPLCAGLAMLFMAVANVYASVVVSKLMLLAPASVKTYGDLGEFAMGRTGRYLVVVSQMGVCLLVPMAFLVLGGILLQVLFPDTYSQSFYIVFMAVMVLPVCLVPTLKEGAGMAFAGCLGTILSDVIAVGVLLREMEGHPPPPAPAFSLGQVLTTFGNLALAYGAAIVIPDLQRQHPQPERMPRVVFVTMVLISVLFVTLAGLGYSAAGCQISGNLLFSIASPTGDGTAPLGFRARRGPVVMAYLFMQLHITIAFSVLLHPAFFVAERLVLGMHRDDDGGDSEYHDLERPVMVESCDDDDEPITRNTDRGHVLALPSGCLQSRAAIKISTSVDNDRDHRHTAVTGSSSSSTCADDDDARRSPTLTMAESSAYRGPRVVVRYVLLRTAIVGALTVLALALREHFLELADFIGASAISVSCLLLPIGFYVRVAGDRLSRAERVFALTIAGGCALCGLYVIVALAGRLLREDAAPTEDPIAFPFCPIGPKQTTPYYVATSRPSL